MIIGSRTPAVLLRMTDMDTSDFRCYASLLDHSIGADHRSRAFQFTPTLALSFIHSLHHSCADISPCLRPAGRR